MFNHNVKENNLCKQIKVISDMAKFLKISFKPFLLNGFESYAYYIFPKKIFTLYYAVHVVSVALRIMSFISKATCLSER